MQRLSFNIRVIGSLVLRYVIVWGADAVSIAVTALLMPGIYFVREAPFWYLHPFTVALLFGLLNALVRPVLLLLLLPITFVTLGLATLVLNAALFYSMNILIGAFVIESFGAAVVGLFVLTLVNTVLGNLIHLGDDYSFYATLMDKFGTLTRPREVESHERGLLVLQIDGLAHATLKKAIRAGKMPFLSTMLKRQRYVLRKWFCSLPSQTSAVQAGIFYGSSYDIPGFRWYDKKARRVVVSSNASDLRAIDERMATNRRSILAEGTCINTLVHGSAGKKLLTGSSLGEKDIKQHRGELEDFAIFSLHPYLYTRTIFLMVWDFIVDRVQAVIDLFRHAKPRLVRSVKFSLHRAVGNTCLREVTSFFVREDIVRGIPIIYANYLGYDMVAHYAGPDSLDALSTLTGIDRRIKQIHRTITRQAPKPFDIVVLSDHGQTPAASFQGLYGMPLEKAIEAKLDGRDVDTGGGGAEVGYFDTLLREVRMVEEAYGTRPIRRSRKTLERIHARVQAQEAERGAAKGAVVSPSGSLAHVYFTESDERLPTEVLFERYRNLIEYLVSHPGIGFVITTSRDGEFLMMGKRGVRRLRSGVIEKDDPLAPFGRGDRRETLARALLRLSSYPSAGDIVLNGAMLKDGRVVTFENQRGTHGGLGGAQTDPFLMYPRRFRGADDRIDGPSEMHDFLRRILPKAAASNVPL